MKYSGCIAQYRPFSLFAFSTVGNGFRGSSGKIIGLCCLLCSMPEGAAFSNGKIACTVYKQLAIRGVIYKLTVLEATSCSEWINIDLEPPVTAAEGPVVCR